MFYFVYTIPIRIYKLMFIHTELYHIFYVCYILLLLPLLLLLIITKYHYSMLLD